MILIKKINILWAFLVPFTNLYNGTCAAEGNSAVSTTESHHADNSSEHLNHHQHNGTEIPILKHSEIVRSDGSFNYSYETGNGINVAQEGLIKHIKADKSKNQTNEDVLSVHGFYSYNAPDGKLVNITYTADENGYVAHGDAIPSTGPLLASLKTDKDHLTSNITHTAKL